MLSIPHSIKSQTLDKVVHLMFAHEPELLAVDADSRSSFHDYQMTLAGRKPTVSLTNDIGLSRRDRSTDALVNQSAGTLLSRDLGVSVRQLLYDGGGTKFQSSSAKEAYRAQRFLQMGMIERRVVDLAEVYMELIRIDKQIAAANENVADHREFRGKLLRREQQGGVRSDTSLIDGRLSLAQNTLATLQLTKDTAISRYRRLAGQMPGKLTQPKVPIVKGGDLFEAPKNWEYLAACATLKSTQARLEAVKKLHHPNVYLDAGANSGRDTIGVSGRDRDLRAIIGFSWDIYRGGERKSEQCREQWQVVRARELLRAADEDRSQRARDLLNERRGSTASRQSLETYVGRLSAVAADYEKQFDIGDRELLNLLDIRNERYQAKSRLIDAKFNEQMSNYRLMGVQGTLVNHFIGDDISKYVGYNCEDSNEWYCDIKNNLGCVSNNCLKAQNCGEKKRPVTVNCDQTCATPTPYVEVCSKKTPKFGNGRLLRKIFSKSKRR